MSKVEFYGAGMGITRTINGERVNLNKMKPSMARRQDMIVEMSERHIRLLVEQDWDGLQKLAEEYQELGAVDTANRIRLESPSNTTKRQSGKKQKT